MRENNRRDQYLIECVFKTDIAAKKLAPVHSFLINAYIEYKIRQHTEDIFFHLHADKCKRKGSERNVLNVIIIRNT